MLKPLQLHGKDLKKKKKILIILIHEHLCTTVPSCDRDWMTQINCVRLTAVAGQCTPRLRVWKTSYGFKGGLFGTGWIWQITMNGCHLHYMWISLSHLGKEMGMWCLLIFHWIEMETMQRFQATSGTMQGGPVCKVMHGLYGLILHAPSITACGIAWGLHCKRK